MKRQKPNWSAKWIWSPDEATSKPNTYVAFRKSININTIPPSALACISADSKYILWVNSKFVCRGVPLCDPLFQYYDEIDIAPYLSAGENVLAALVHYYGVGTSTYQHSGRPGFLFEARLGDETLISDASWKTHFLDAYLQNVPWICATHMLQGFQEHFDARNEPIGWREVGFDDSSWPDARVISWLGNDKPPIEPWLCLRPRDIPHYFEEERPAASVSRVGEVVDAPLGSNNDLSEKKHREPICNLGHCSVENPEAMIAWNDSYTLVRQDNSNPSVCPSVIIDFGREVTGMISIDVEGPAGAIIDIALAELLTSNGINHYWGDLIGMGVAHRYTLRDGRQRFETFGRFGFRYAHLTFRKLTSPLKIYRVSVNFSSYNVEHRGRFECNDNLLNAIWDAGAYTAQCCMYDGWEDCPGREQRQWIGDGRVEAMIAYAAFGDTALTRKFLVQAAQSQRTDGMTMMFYPGCAGIVGTSIVDYNLHWLLAIEEYLLYSGDEEILRELYPKIVLSMQWWEERTNAEGLLENVPSHLYLDACTPEIPKIGIVTVLNCFYLATLRAVARFARTAGDRENMRKWRDAAEALPRAINEMLFDKAAGVYADAFVGGSLSETRSQHSNLLPLLLDIVPMDRLDSVWRHVTNEDHLCRTKKDYQAGKKIAAAQPFFTHFLFEMLAKRGRIDILVDLTRNLWKPMIDAGQGTLWETWNDPRLDVEAGTQSSMCHAWSGTPTFHLSSEVLGVRPTAPGFAKFDIKPKPADLSYARGVFPSVKGNIEVDWQKSSECFAMRFTVPQGTVARVVLPVCNPKSVTLDGVKTEAYVATECGVEFTNIQEGSHQVEATTEAVA